jgi:hypothetical protein
MRSAEAKDLIRDLIHEGDYDPAKRREYYLRVRALKGRQPGKGVVTKNDAHARQVEVKAKVAKLKARLGELKKKLEDLRVKAKDKDAKDKGTDKSTSGDKSSSTDSKDQKPLTAAQKREKADKAKKKYDEEHPKEPTTEKELLVEISKVEQKIKAIIAEARNKHNTGS